MRDLNLIAALLAQLENSAELSPGLQDADRIDIFAQLDGNHHAHRNYSMSPSAKVYHFNECEITSKISFMLRFRDLLMRFLPIFGGEAFAHIEVIRLATALQSALLWFLLRLVPTFLLFGYIIPPNDVYFLLELVVLLNEELVHLHQLPVRLVLSLSITHTLPLHLFRHFYEYFSVALDQFFSLFLRFSQQTPQLLYHPVLFHPQRLSLELLLPMKLLQFLKVVVIDQSFLVDARLNTLVQLCHEFLQLLLALLDLPPHSFLLDYHLLTVSSEVPHEFPAGQALSFPIVCHYIQFQIVHQFINISISFHILLNLPSFDHSASQLEDCIIIMSQIAKDEQQQYEDLQQLRQRVHLSSNKLLQLTYNDNKYMDKLISYNLESKKLINEDLIQEALIYLAQAERILQYGASCGKSIDRNIIITTLHNEACCYYKEADLTTAAKYLEGLIFNLKSHLDSLQSSPSSSSVDHKRTNTDSFLYLTLEKKIELVQYYLKFCTINSQAKRREVALDAGKKVIQLCSSLFADLQQENVKITNCDENNKEAELNDLRWLISSIRVFKQQLKLTDLNNYILCARYWIKKWNNSKVVKKISFSLEKHVNNYSISEVIDMAPIEYRADDDQYYDTFLNTRNILRQILHFSMGYFTISTEYRLIAEQMYKDYQERVKSQEFIKANIYHLLSILFLTYNLNCDLLFMKQVISSYEHHFKTDLSSSENDEQIEQISEALLFEPKKVKQKLNTTTMNEKLAQKAKKKRLISEYQDSYIYENKISMKMSVTKMQEKLKRSLSKKQGLSSSKKFHNKIINQTLLESSKVIKDRSISRNQTKIRSISKDSSNVKVQERIKVQEKIPVKNKKATDEYQLGQSKPTRKRINTASSADLSISCKGKDLSKRKQIYRKTEKLPKAKEVKAPKGKAKPKEKQVINKHYYL